MHAYGYSIHIYKDFSAGGLASCWTVVDCGLSWNLLRSAGSVDVTSHLLFQFAVAVVAHRIGCSFCWLCNLGFVHQPRSMGDWVVLRCLSAGSWLVVFDSPIA